MSSQILLLMIMTSFANSVHSFVVALGSGSVRGSVKEISGGRKIKQFFGIPFAQPPVSELRWSEPRPIEEWTGEMSCTIPNKPECPQRHTAGVLVSEDCLYLNIYTPYTASRNSNLSVLIWIHGGCFTSGSGTLYDGTYLSSYNDVIMVMINYRLGVLGFMPFPGTESNGNYGLFDQLLALKWIKNNIKYFGGNPNSMTLFGSSAGAVSASLLSLSPLGAGLFQRVISQSGSAIAGWGVLQMDHDTEIRQFASHLSCSENLTMQEILSCLRGKTFEEIIRAQTRINSGVLGQSPLISPTVDGKLLRDLPLNLLRAGKVLKVDHMMGVMQNDGSNFIKKGMNQDTLGKLINKWMIREIRNSAIKDDVMRIYKQNASSPRSWRQECIEFVSDYVFIAPAEMLAREISKTGVSVYFYVLSQRYSQSSTPPWQGVSHPQGVYFGLGFPLASLLSSEKKETLASCL